MTIKKTGAAGVLITDNPDGSDNITVYKVMGTIVNPTAAVPSFQRTMRLAWKEPEWRDSPKQLMQLWIDQSTGAEEWREIETMP